MNLNYETDTEVLVYEDVDIDSLKENQLIVYNDEVNTFDHVINTLIDICSHSQEQAEQCTYIIHYKGKCSVKEGPFDDLVPLRNAICDRGISAEVT